jgi:hypothetical protein
MLIPILMAIPDGDHDMVSVIAGYASMGATGALTGTLACIAVAAPWTGSVGITRAVAGSFIGTLGSIIVGGSLVSLGLTDLGSISAKNLVALGTVLAVTFAVVLTVTNPILKYYKDLLESDRQEAWFSFWLRYFLAIPFGISVGLGLAGNFSAHFLIPATAIASGAALLYVSFNPILQHHRQLATYRRQEQHLIEP